MRNVSIRALALIVLTVVPGFARQTNTSVLGTVTSINMNSGAIEVKPDNAPGVPVHVTATTAIQRIAPGETTLRNAAAIQLTNVSVGDRVLVTLGPKPTGAASPVTDALRVVVMSAGEIAKRDDAEHEDWLRRGVSGVVSAKNGTQISLKTQQTIVVSGKTTFRRYSPDSVTLVDAKPGNMDEVAVGDLIRARGVKSADGMKVDAEEVIFGTFLTRAGSVTAVDTAAREITVRELGTGSSFIIRIAADSAIKQFPSAPAGRGAPSAGPTGPNVSQMIDTLPLAKIEDIKPGTSVVVSGTKGSQGDKVTAILMIGNADPLIRTATPSGRGGTLVFGTGGGGGLDVLAIP